MEELYPKVFSYYDDSLEYKYLQNFKNILVKLLDPSDDMKENGDVILEFPKKDLHLFAYFIGSYYPNDEIWIWNWCHPEPKNTFILGEKILNYALNLDQNNLQREDFQLIRSILINSRIKVKNNYNLEFLEGLILMICNLRVIIPIKKIINGKTVLSFYGIRNPNDNFKN